MCGVLILGVRGLFGLERRENHVRWMEGTCRCVSGASTIELGGFGCFEGAVGRVSCWCGCVWAVGELVDGGGWRSGHAGAWWCVVGFAVVVAVGSEWCFMKE